MNRILMLKGGSPAIHKLGNIGRENDELIRIHSQDDEYYIGSFEEGFGFIDVKFKKSDCRLLNKQERDNLNGNWYSINGNPLYKIYIDEQGNIVEGNVKYIKGKIINVLDTNTKTAKHNNFWGLDVRFTNDDLIVGKNLIMLLDAGGYITTSKIEDIEFEKDVIKVITKNSTYYINNNT